MLLLLLNYVVLRVLWKIDVHLISTLVNKSLYYIITDHPLTTRNNSFQFNRLLQLRPHLSTFRQPFFWLYVGLISVGSMQLTTMNYTEACFLMRMNKGGFLSNDFEYWNNRHLIIQRVKPFSHWYYSWKKCLRVLQFRHIPRSDKKIFQFYTTYRRGSANPKWK